MKRAAVSAACIAAGLSGGERSEDPSERQRGTDSGALRHSYIRAAKGDPDREDAAGRAVSVGR